MTVSCHPSIRALIVDDFAPWRDCLSQLLASDSRIKLVGQAEDGGEAVECAMRLQPDLILLDIGLPKMNGIEAGLRISQLSPHSRIIYVTQNLDIETMRLALARGATGYVLKMHAARDLLSAVNCVLADGTFVSDALIP